MGVDLIVLIVLVVFVFLGWRRGLLRHLAGLGALVVASLAAGFAAREGAALIAPKGGMPSAATYAICCVVAWLVLYFVCRFIFRLVAKKIGSTEQGEPKPWNKKLGALAGAIEALLVCWLVIGILDALPEDFRKQQLPRVHRELEGSLFTNWVVRPTSPATMLELQPLISDLAAVSEHPEALRGVERNEKLRDIVKHPKVAAIVTDRALLDTWAAGEYGRFFSDRKVREALEDPEVRKMLRELPVRSILHEAAETVRQDKAKAR